MKSILINLHIFTLSLPSIHNKIQISDTKVFLILHTLPLQNYPSIHPSTPNLSLSVLVTSNQDPFACSKFLDWFELLTSWNGFD